MNKITTSGLKSGLIVLLAIVTINCAPKQEVKIPPQKVNVVLTQQKNITKHVDFVGQVYGFKDISIRARVDGFLEGIHFKEGFPVKEGQPLYSIDSQPYKAEVLSFESKLAESKTNLAKAEGDLNRYKPLAESNAVSQADLDAAQAQFDAANSSVHAAEANLELAKIKLGYTEIHSPIDGVIGKTEAVIGEYVGRMPNAVILNTISKIDEILVDFFLPENQYLTLVKNFGSADSLFNSTRKGKSSLELVLADGSIHDSKGYINFIDRAVDESTGAILIQAHFDNKKRIVRPGQYAKVRIPISVKDAIIIPQKCVIELQGQYSVFVVTDENKVENRQIFSGGKLDDLWIIEKGVEPGDKVIIDGIQKVRNGAIVEASTIEFESISNSN